MLPCLLPHVLYSTANLVSVATRTPTSTTPSPRYTAHSRRPMPATLSSLPAAAQRSMAPHRAAGANDLFMPCADVKLVPMAPDDQCLYSSVIAALEDIGHHKSTFTVQHLRQLVQKSCHNNAARKVNIGAWAIPLLSLRAPARRRARSRLRPPQTWWRAAPAPSPTTTCCG